MLQGFNEPDETDIVKAIKMYGPQSVFLLSSQFVRLATAFERVGEGCEGQAGPTTIMPAASAIPFQSELELRAKLTNLKAVPCCYGSSETGIFTYADTNAHLGRLMCNVEAKASFAFFLTNFYWRLREKMLRVRHSLLAAEGRMDKTSGVVLQVVCRNVQHKLSGHFLKRDEDQT